MRQMNGGFVYGLFLIVGVGLIGLATSVAARSPSPAPVVAEYTEPQAELYEWLYAPTPVASASAGLWSDADRVKMTATALLVVTEPTSRETWKPGFQAYLRDTIGLTDEEVRAAVFRAYGKLSVMIANAVFAEMDKPG